MRVETLTWSSAHFPRKRPAHTFVQGASPPWVRFLYTEHSMQIPRGSQILISISEEMNSQAGKIPHRKRADMCIFSPILPEVSLRAPTVFLYMQDSKREDCTLRLLHVAQFTLDLVLSHIIQGSCVLNKRYSDYMQPTSWRTTFGLSVKIDHNAQMTKESFRCTLVKKWWS